MAHTHADALDFLARWYDEQLRTAYTPPTITRSSAATATTANHFMVPGFTDLMTQAQVVSDFLALDSTVAYLVLQVGAPIQQDGSPVPDPLAKKGSVMQLRDNEQFDITLEAKDAKGFDVTGDAFTATVDDESVVTVDGPDESGTFTVVAGAPGSAVITFADSTGISATEAVDVVPGDVATVTITEGPTSEQGGGDQPVINPEAGRRS
jgi:hypothetical protein